MQLKYSRGEALPVLRVLKDRGTEYCRAPDRHPYQLFLQFNEIEHTKTKFKSPQTNGICERAYQTILNVFYRVTFRKKVYSNHESLQTDLDEYMNRFNAERTHQGTRCKGRTPMATFLGGLELYKEKNLAEKLAA